ncbi:MAG: hypothetical protein EBR82_07355 [Caulobacteraceae bacterium]|nr:hypothetical protein [Caulobacteraceae bacterium]
MSIKHGDQWTLGHLIYALKSFDGARKIRFDFAAMVPGAISSYRGYYEDLAVEPQFCSKGVATSDFIERLTLQVGSVEIGYKGGEYRSSLNTALWVARHSESTGTYITGVDDLHGGPVITTRTELDWL